MDKYEEVCDGGECELRVMTDDCFELNDDPFRRFRGATSLVTQLSTMIQL